MRKTYFVPSISILFFSLLIGKTGKAESVLQMLPIALDSERVGIVGGAIPRDTHPLTKQTAFLRTRFQGTNQGRFCTLTLFRGGCGVTARHCFELGGKNWKEGEIFTGATPDTSKKPNAKIVRVVQNKGKLKEDDIVVVQLNRNLPGFDHEALADKKLNIKRNTLVQIFGYGERETREDPRTGKLVDFGVGIFHAGRAAFRGYGWIETNRRGASEMDLDEEGEALWVTRATSSFEPRIYNVPSEADSGGPLLYKGKIYGTTILGLHSAGLLLNQRNLAQNVWAAAYTSIPVHRKWILNSFKKLNCSNDLKKLIFEFVKKHFYQFNLRSFFTKKQWGEFDRELRGDFEYLLQQLVDDRGSFVFEGEVDRGDFVVTLKNPMSKEIEYTVTIERDGSVDYR